MKEAHMLQLEPSLSSPQLESNEDSVPARNKNIFKKTHVPQCSLQHYLQQSGHGSNLDVHWQMKG